MRNKKMIIPALLIVVVLCIIVVSALVFGDDKIEFEKMDKFNDMPSFTDVLEDIKGVDLYTNPDFTGLKVKTKVDEENDTRIDYYYDGDTLVYADYIGFGEDSFEYYTKSNSGKDIVVMYVDLDEKRYEVDVKCDEYHVSLEDLDKKATYGANLIYVCLQEQTEDDAPRTITYCYDHGDKYAYGVYEDDLGYHNFGVYSDESENYDDIVNKRVDDIKISEQIPKVVNDSRVDVAQIAVGSHEIVYTKSSDYKRHWYIIADVTAVFSDESDANEFAREYGLKAEETDMASDGDKWLVVFKDSVIPVSDAYEDFDEFVRMEVDDCYYSAIELDEDGKLVNLNRDKVTISYY